MLDGGDVHEHIASAVIRFDKSVSAFAVEEFDRTGHCHRENSYPVVVRRRPPRHDGRAAIRNWNRRRPWMASVTLHSLVWEAAPKGSRTSEPHGTVTHVLRLERGLTSLSGSYPGRGGRPNGRGWDRVRAIRPAPGR